MYPALAVLDALQLEVSTLDVLWVGGEGGMEAQLIERVNIPFKTIPAAGVHGVGLIQLPRNIRKLARGVIAARRVLRNFKPDVLFFTGGYLAIPMAIAGRKIPIVLYVPDIEPGLAIKTIAQFADGIAVTADDSYKYYRNKRQIRCTGYPTRSSLRKWSREEARRLLNLNDEPPVLLVLGGSKGARSINNAVLEHLTELLGFLQLIHISGEQDWLQVSVMVKNHNHPHYHPFPYLHEEMGAAFAASDIVLSRAGASILGEYPLFGLPSMLVPYPHAWRYQKVNADFLVRHNAAVIVEDANLDNQIVPVVKNLLKDNPQMESMRMSVKSLANPDAARSISQLLMEQAGRGKE